MVYKLFDLLGSMNGSYSNASASASSSSSLDSSSHDTEDDQTIATILAEEEKLKSGGKLGKRLSHLDSIPVCWFIMFYVSCQEISEVCHLNVPCLCVCTGAYMYEREVVCAFDGAKSRTLGSFCCFMQGKNICTYIL